MCINVDKFNPKQQNELLFVDKINKLRDFYDNRSHFCRISQRGEKVIHEKTRKSRDENIRENTKLSTEKSGFSVKRSVFKEKIEKFLYLYGAVYPHFKKG